MIYLVILIFLLLLSFIYDINEKTEKKLFWYNCILVTFILLAGLRYRVGVDTTYEIYDFYHETPTLDKLFDDLSLFEYPLWIILNSIVYTLGGKFFIVQLIESAFVNILVFKYIKKHSPYLFTCVFFYYIYLYASFNFEEMKASFSAALCLFANDYILEKKWGKGIALYVIGCLFHISTILLFPFSLLLFVRFNKFGVAFLLFGFLVGKVVETKIGDYLFLLDADGFVSEKVEGYATSDRFGSRGTTSLLFAINQLTGYIYPLLGLVLLKMKEKENALLSLEPFLMFCLFFMTLTYSIPIFYRYSHFYDIYYVFFVSALFVLFAKKGFFTIGLSYLRCIIIFLPFFFHIYKGYTPEDRFKKFYPYSSVIDRTVYKSKENRFNQEGAPSPQINEY